jgi:heat shock protein HslJ
MRDLTLTEMGCTSYDQTMERGFLAMTGEPIQFTMMDDKLMLANAGGSAILGPADGQYR